MQSVRANRIDRILAVCALAATASLVPRASEAARPAKRLNRGMQLYFAGELDKALDVFQRLDATSTPKMIRIEALKHKAFVLFELHLHDEARDVWLRVLDLDPEVELDPVDVSPELRSFFDSIELTPNRAPAVVSTSTEAEPAVRSTVAERGCGVALCLVPFGVGQFANGRQLKGGLFAGAEALLLAANVGLYWVARSEAEGSDDANTRSTVENYYVAQRISFGLFAAAALWGILDAFLFP